MSVEQSIEAALSGSFVRNTEVHANWVKAYHMAMGKYGRGLITLIGYSNIDMLLRSLETESQPRVGKPERSPVSHTPTLMLALSEAWMIGMYEVLRVINDQANKRGMPLEKAKELRDKYALVRMPLAKAEIAWADRLKPELDLYPLATASEAPPKRYEADGSYMVPRYISADNGALEWRALDLKNKIDVMINRQKMSDETLEFLSSL